MNSNTPHRLALAAALVLAIGSVSAASPHFVKGPDASINNAGVVTVSWKEAGLGDNQNIAYIASALATARYQCVNRGGNCPAAANKQDVSGEVYAQGTFSSGRNGQISASLNILPPASTLVCPGNQRVALVSVNYWDIALADTTNNVVALADPSELGISNPECPG
ncbi:MAG TPA: hypothetical protein VK827_10935 [Lysobacter sp.]|nr:hypothetical protein [Lysobacter sp.]